MEQRSCISGDCVGKPIGRGLCNRHYYEAKRNGTLDEIAPRASHPCDHCGGAIPANRRFGARYCSTRCKEADRVEHTRQAVVARRQGRTCLECGSPISVDASGKARTCSRACGVAWQNRLRAEKRRGEWLATKGPCRGCGADIPDAARAGSTFCSRECRRARGRALNYDPVRARDYNRRYNYGITAAAYDALLAAQNGKCAICGTSDWPGKGNRPHVDHCHNGGGVRGILCHFCNLGLGDFADDPQRLRKAAEYLERSGRNAAVLDRSAPAVPHR